MKEVQIGHTLCSPEALKTPLKNQVRQNAQPSTGRGIAKFRYDSYFISTIIKEKLQQKSARLCAYICYFNCYIL